MSMAMSSEQLTLFVADSLANLSVLPGSKKAKRMTAISGQKCLGLLKQSNPLGLLAKMFLESLDWHSTMCYLIWKAKATKLRHLLFQLVPSVRGIEGTEYGLLPTPQTMDAIGMTREVFRRGKSYRIKSNQGVEGQAGLRDVAMMYPSPSATDYKGSGRHGKPRDRLDYAVERGVTKSRLYPTPRLRDSEGGICQGIAGTSQRISKAGMKLSNMVGFWESEPGVGMLDHGVPERVAKLKALGNAVVPQVVEIIGRYIMQFEKEKNADNK